MDPINIDIKQLHQLARLHRKMLMQGDLTNIKPQQRTVYIASTLSNWERVVDLRNKLSIVGVSLSYDWTSHCRVSDPDLLRQIAINEINGIVKADVILVVAPARFGTHFEFGLAFGLKKKIVYLIDKYDGPDEPIMHLDNVLYYNDEDAALREVAQASEPIANHLIDLCYQAS